MNEIIKVEGKKFSDNSIPVTNSRKVLDWIVNTQFKTEKNLMQNLIVELTELFGPHNRGLRLEFLTKLWILKYNDITFNVFTAKGKGTSIEIVDQDWDNIRFGNKDKEIIEFLEKLTVLVNKKNK
jgi:hypothetical protein